MPSKKMTPKQQAFCDYYIETGNGAEAARRAGYKGKNLEVIASQNLTKLNISQYINKHMEKAHEKRIATADEVLQYLTNVMKGEEKDQFGLDASLQDRTRAAELLGKRYSIFTDKIKHEGVQQVVIQDDIPVTEDEG